MNLSQAEIDALLGGGGAAVTTEAAAEPEETFLMEYAEGLAPWTGALTSVEIDTLGEVGNICMGAVATTMYMLLDRRVDITTPLVEVMTINEVLAKFPTPLVIVEVEYVEGILGRNLLLLDEHDAALITDVLMGGEGVVEEPIELSELHMSAMNEITNQMIGASATALSQVIGRPVNISTPQSYHMTLGAEIAELFGSNDTVIEITFDMEIDGLLNNKLIQLMPYEQGRAMSNMLTSANEANVSVKSAPEAPPSPSPSPTPVQPAYTQPEAAYPPGFEPAVQPVPGELVDVRPLQFQSFDDNGKQPSNEPSGIDTIYNIPLTVAAELGTTTMQLNEVLDFEPGVVIMLEKSAGDPVEVLVNGKKIARGEVVIIDDNYGVRITELPEG